MTYQVVPIAEEHIAEYHAVLDRVAREGKYLAFYEAPPLESTAEWVRGNIRDDVAQFVALCGGGVAGWCDISPSSGQPSMAHIGTLGIGLLPEWRGKGIGGALMRAAVEKARAKGLVRIELTVREANAPAIALYTKMGFEMEGLNKKAHRNADGSYENVCMMALTG